MIDTDFSVPEDKLDRLPAAYRHGGGGLVETEAAGGGFYAGPPPFDVSHGELVSTVADFHRFIRLLADGGRVDGEALLSAEHLQQMTSDQVPAENKTPDSFFPGFWDGMGWGFGVGVQTPKSDAGRREVAIPPHILPTVINHLERFSEPGPDGLVFVGPRGGVLSSANFGADVWRPAVVSVGLKGFTFHGLRGVSATLAARHGATTKELMRRLGHATADMSMRYQRAETDRDRALANAMSDDVLNQRTRDTYEPAPRVSASPAEHVEGDGSAGHAEDPIESL